MAERGFSHRSFMLFFRYNRVQFLSIFLISLFLSLSQGFTILLLIPMLSLLDPSGSGIGSNRFLSYFESFFRSSERGISLETILAIYAVVLIMVALLSYFRSMQTTSYQQGFLFEMRNRLFKKVLYSDWSYINSTGKYNHIQVLTNEIPRVSNYYYFYIDLLSKLLFTFAHIVVAMTISVRFTLFVIAIGILLFFLLRKNIGASKGLGNEMVAEFRKMLKGIDDFWLTVKIAKVHNSEGFYMDKFEQTNAKIFRNQKKVIYNRANPQLIFTISGVLILIATVWVAYNYADIALSSLFVLIALFARIFPQFSAINNDLNMMVSNNRSVEIVMELDALPEREASHTGRTPNSLLPLKEIAIERLSFSHKYGDELFVNFSESFPAGKITGITGRSGSGKTTLLDVVAALIRSNNHSLKIDDTYVTDLNLQDWCSTIGYLPQDSFFIDGKIRDNLIWDTKESITDERIFEVLDMVGCSDIVRSRRGGLDNFIFNYSLQFSGGERQRLALARLLLRRPRVMLLDEATSSLDSYAESQVINSLLSLRGEVTTLFVTHRVELLKHFDKVIDLDSYRS